MKDTYYFSHDSNARHDPKISALICKYGVAGYGMFWILIEMLREADEFKLPLKKYIWNAIAMQMQCTPDATENFVKSCINEYELLTSDDQFFWSNSLIKRMQKRTEISEKRSNSAKKRWLDANAMQTDANAMQSCALKESKGKESKVFIIPTIEQITEYCNTRKNNVDPIRFYNHYQSKGWMIGKNKMKDWKAAVHTWENSDNTPHTTNKNAGFKIPEGYEQ